MAKKETVILDFEVDSKDAVVSIENLTKANKALREERKKVDLSTEEGIKRVKDINTQIDRNNELIKNNSSTLEKNRLNVGNYTESIKAATPALDKLTGGLYSAAEGAAGLTKQTLAFIATGWGAVLIAAGAALYALMQYFKGSEEGQDKLAKITAIGTVFMEKFQLVIEAVGETLATTEGGIGDLVKKFGLIAVGMEIALLPLRALIKGVELLGETFAYVFPSAAATVKGFVDGAVKQGERMADLDDQIGAKENELIVRRAQVSLQVAQIREKAIGLEGEAKRKAIEEAIQLEKDLASEETEHAQMKLALVEEEIAMTGAATEEQKQQRAEAQADVLAKQAEAYQATLRFTKELEKLNDAHNKKVEEQNAVHEAKKRAQSDSGFKMQVDKTIESQNTQVALTNTFAASVLAAQKKLQQDTILTQEETAKLEMDVLIKRANNWASKLSEISDNVSKGLGMVSGIEDQYFANQEAKLALNVANEKAALQAQYADEAKLLEERFNNGEISQDEYNKQIQGLNEKLKADEKAAQIRQAQELNNIKEKEFKADKALRIVQIAIDTASAVAKSIAASPLSFGLPWSAAAAATGAAQTALVLAQKFVPTTFRTGGYTGDGSPDQLAGLTHKGEFVMPYETVQKYGRDHFESYMDGSIVANAASANVQAATQQNIKVELVYSEFKRFTDQVQYKEQLAKA